MLNIAIDDYVNLMKEDVVLQSLAGRARWVGNVIIERWFCCLKYENIYINEYNTSKELRSSIVQFHCYLHPKGGHDAFEIVSWQGAFKIDI